MEVKDLTGSVTQKLGPLPVWAWGGIVGGAWILYSRSKPQTRAKVTETIGLEARYLPGAGAAPAQEIMPLDFWRVLPSGEEISLSGEAGFVREIISSPVVTPEPLPKESPIQAPVFPGGVIPLPLTKPEIKCPPGSSKMNIGGIDVCVPDPRPPEPRPTEPAPAPRPSGTKTRTVIQGTRHDRFYIEGGDTGPVMHTFSDNSGLNWSQVWNLGGTTSDIVGAYADHPRYTVRVVGTDGNIWRNHYNGGWSGWHRE